MTLLFDMLYLALAAAGMSVVLSEAAITSKIRHYIGKIHSLIEELINCPYCLGHWFSFSLVLWKFGAYPVDKFFVTVFGVAAITSIIIKNILELFIVLNKLDKECVD